MPTDLWSPAVIRSTQPGRRRGISSVTISGRTGATAVGGVMASPTLRRLWTAFWTKSWAAAI